VYSKKDGPFFTEQDADNFNTIVHGGWGVIFPDTREAELA
jgi:hypothetical protein